MQDSASTCPAPGALKVFAKHGHVILRLGWRRFLVWSGLPLLASPVFAAMFNGRSLEGQLLSAASPPELPLPDDDAAAMSVLCKTIHLQTENISTSMDYADLGTLALLADKYNCTHLLLPCHATCS
jgi:hypothetical protein